MVVDKTGSKKYCVSSGSIVKDAIKTLNAQKGKIVIVLNSENVVLGTITDGDIRRALLDGITVDYHVENVMNKDYLFVKEEDYSNKRLVNYLLSILLNNYPF